MRYNEYLRGYCQRVEGQCCRWAERSSGPAAPAPHPPNNKNNNDKRHRSHYRLRHRVEARGWIVDGLWVSECSGGLGDSCWDFRCWTVESVVKN